MRLREHGKDMLGCWGIHCVAALRTYHIARLQRRNLEPRVLDREPYTRMRIDHSNSFQPKPSHVVSRLLVAQHGKGPNGINQLLPMRSKSVAFAGGNFLNCLNNRVLFLRVCSTEASLVLKHAIWAC